MPEIVVGNKRPFGFYVCSFAFTLERMAYYAAKYMIFVFVSAAVTAGGLGLSTVDAAELQANLVGFTYLAPIIGGYLSDHYVGARYCIPVGLLCMAGGYWMGSTATSAAGINLMVALVAIGTGLFKGNCAAITGTLFDDEKEFDSAFSTQYSFVNVGALIGTLTIGLLIGHVFADGAIQGFKASFKLVALICVLDSLWFFWGMRYLGESGKKPFKMGRHVEKQIENSKPLTRAEKRKTAAIVLVSLFSIAFWVCWYLTYVSFYDYGGKFIDMTVGSFTVPLSWFDSLNSLSCIVLGPVLGVLWYKLSKRPQGDLSLFKKLAFGIGFLGLSFFCLVFAEITRGVGAPETAKASLLWAVGFAVLLSLGEMFFSPLGNSFISKHAPSRLLSSLMGVWVFATFIAGKSYGYLYGFVSKFSVIQAYTAIPIILFVLGVLLFIFDKKLTVLLKSDSELETEHL